MGSYRIRNTRDSIAQYITTLEFAKSLARVLGIDKAIQHGRKWSVGTIGLAISGGVDSMALAALCSNIQNLPRVKAGEVLGELHHLRKISFRAFIVNHQVRPGSDEEARAVSNVLKRGGIKSEVLEMHWSDSQVPATASNFESLARTYRFRLLGQACKDAGIESLLLAHHEDDQVETIMMRMIAGHRRSGLIGIKESGSIPECYGIHGIHESGGLLNGTPSYPPKLSATNLQLPIENGGVRIYRPLLGFSKARLVATCEREKMKWFEDHTNKDPTLTKRNAIRHMYNTYNMPTALTKPAILTLRQRCQDSILHEDAVVNSLIAKSDIKKFNTRIGTVTVRFPESNVIYAAAKESKQDYSRIAAKILRRILLLVTPQEHIELASLQGTVRYLFPGLFGLATFKEIPPKAFTVASIHLQPMVPRVPGQEREAHLIDDSEMKEGRDQPLWLLSRQPYSLSNSLPSIVIPPSNKCAWTPWKLFDGRYWIRVQNRSNDLTMNIRPFAPHDMKKFQSSMDGPHKRKFLKVLKAEASGDMRWTLPSLSFRTIDDGDITLALPTLGFYGQKREIDALARWEVRYKKVDLLRCADQLSNSPIISAHYKISTRNAF